MLPTDWQGCGGVQGDKNQTPINGICAPNRRRQWLGQKIPTLSKTWLLDAIVVVERVLTNTPVSAHWTFEVI